MFSVRLFFIFLIFCLSSCGIGKLFDGDDKSDDDCPTTAKKSGNLAEEWFWEDTVFCSECEEEPDVDPDELRTFGPFDSESECIESIINTLKPGTCPSSHVTGEPGNLITTCMAPRIGEKFCYKEGDADPESDCPDPIDTLMLDPTVPNVIIDDFSCEFDRLDYAGCPLYVFNLSGRAVGRDGESFRINYKYPDEISDNFSSFTAECENWGGNTGCFRADGMPAEIDWTADITFCIEDGPITFLTEILDGNQLIRTDTITFNCPLPDIIPDTTCTGDTCVTLDSCAVLGINCPEETCVGDTCITTTCMQDSSSCTILTCVADTCAFKTCVGDTCTEQGLCHKPDDTCSIIPCEGEMCLVDPAHLDSNGRYTTDPMKAVDFIPATGCTDIKEGRVGLYSFNGNADDASGLDNHGTLSGAVNARDRFGNSDGALRLNILQDFIQVPKTFQKDFAMAFWLKNSLIKEDVALVASAESESSIDFLIEIIESKLQFSVGDPATFTQLKEPDYPTGSWNYIAVNRNYASGNIELYFNGELVGRAYGTVENLLLESNDSVTFGKFSELQEELIIILDDLVLYNRTLCPSQIDSMYQTGNWPESGVEVPDNAPPVFITDARDLEDKIELNDLYEASFEATDPDGDMLTYNLISLPGDAGFSDQAISWEPEANHVGHNSFIIEATDSEGGSDTLSWNVLVLPPLQDAEIVFTDESLNEVDVSFTEGSNTIRIVLTDQTPYPDTNYSIQISTAGGDAETIELTIENQLSLIGSIPAGYGEIAQSDNSLQMLAAGDTITATFSDPWDENDVQSSTRLYEGRTIPLPVADPDSGTEFLNDTLVNLSIESGFLIRYSLGDPLTVENLGQQTAGEDILLTESTVIYAMGFVSYGENNIATTPALTLEYTRITNNYWSNLPVLPTPRYGLSAVTINGLIQVAGGLTQNDASTNEVNIFTPETTDGVDGGQWSTGDILGSSLCIFGMAELDGIIYITGGRLQRLSSPLNVASRYDPMTGIRTPIASMDSARASHKLVALNGKLYAIGGMNPGGDFMKSIEEYDPDLDQWTQKTPLDASRSHFGAAAAGGKIYVIGGAGSVSDVDIYDPLSDVWTTGPALSSPRSNLAAVTVNNRIYAIGGDATTNENQFSKVESLEIGGSSWVEVAPLNHPRQLLAASVVDGKIYVVGGLGITNIVTDALEVYIPIP